jgi:1,5-anhydro-D-fructose reductase (1,5-anhydro-D-mannitol-forming)
MTGEPGVRWGMIGVGSVAEHKSGPAFLQAAGGVLAAVASRRADKARDYATRHGVPLVFSTPEALIESDQVDAIYIATPPSSHARYALAAARAGKHCCIEKPMTVHLEDAIEVCQAFEAADLLLFVSYYRRSLPRFRAVTEIIERGHIGSVESVTWTLTRIGGTPVAGENWRIHPDDAPGGIFEDLACHGLDLFDCLFGPVTQVDGSTLAYHDAPVPDRVEARWRHAAIDGHGLWDFAATQRSDEVTILGHRGRIRFAMFDDRPIEVIRDDRDATRMRIDNPIPIQLPHVVALNRALNDGAAHPSTGLSALRTQRISDLILRGPNARHLSITSAGSPAGRVPPQAGHT